MKPYKLKNYSKKTPFGKGPKRTGRTVLFVVLLVALIFIGISAYKPIYNFVTGRMKPNPLPESTIEPSSVIEPPPSQPDVPVEPEVSQPEEKPNVLNISEVRGVVLPYDVAMDDVKLKEFIKELPSGINTLYFDGKDAQGKIYFKTENKKAKEWESVIEKPVDLKVLSEKLKKEDLNLGVKLSVFSDPQAARGDNLANAIMHGSGVIWIDNLIENGGKPWLTPYADGGRTYHTDLIQELSQQEISLIVLDHVMFPDDPTGSAVVKEKKDVSKHQILAQFIDEAVTAGGNMPVGIMLSEPRALDANGGENMANYGGNPLEFKPSFFVVSMVGKKIDEKSMIPEGLKEKDVVIYITADKTTDLSKRNEPYIVQITE